MSNGPLQDLSFRIGTVFRPAAPINRADLFAGRRDQIKRLVDTINQPGQHAILFGERGVGKTSLANMVFPTFKSTGGMILVPHVNCSHSDDFSRIWKRVFREALVKLDEVDGHFDLSDREYVEECAASDSYEVTIDHVRRVLGIFGSRGVFACVIDEFDTVSDHKARLAMADTLKTLSDRNSPATAVLIGVADDIASLISNHQSVERCLRQIQLGRMTRDETEELIQTGLKDLSMSIEKHALHEISRLARGLPHYAHLLGLHSGKVAVGKQRTQIKGIDMPEAVSLAVADVQSSVQNEYIHAITSARKDAQYKQVLLAAALATCDELGFFYANDVTPAFSRIMGKKSKIDSFSKLLNAFCESERGKVLVKDQRSSRPRYRFSNPLLQPYVLIRGLSEGLLTEDDLKETRSDSDKGQMKLF